jgi:hypothetical protein
MITRTIQVKPVKKNMFLSNGEVSGENLNVWVRNGQIKNSSEEEKNFSSGMTTSPSSEM